MIFIYLSDILKHLKGIYNTDETVKKVCNLILIFISVSSIIGLIKLASTLGKNIEKSRLASTYYECWLEQLPPEHPIKEDIYEVVLLYKLQNSLSLTAGALFDSQEQIIKYEFGKFDLTEFGILETYLSKKFDESKPEYLLMDKLAKKPLSKIKLSKGELKTIEFYRNGKEIPINYFSPENEWKSSHSVEFNELISLGLVKAYVKNPEIAKIIDNQVVALDKGKTKLMLIYGTQLLELDIVVK